MLLKSMLEASRLLLIALKMVNRETICFQGRRLIEHLPGKQACCAKAFFQPMLANLSDSVPLLFRGLSGYLSILGLGVHCIVQTAPTHSSELTTRIPQTVRDSELCCHLLQTQGLRNICSCLGQRL